MTAVATADQWTAEQHPHPASFKPTWFCMAPASDPLAGHPGRYPFHWLIDGRRAYRFVDQDSAHRAADRANTTTPTTQEA